MNSRDYRSLKGRIITAYRMQTNDYEHLMDTATANCTDRQWDSICRAIDNAAPLTPAEQARITKRNHRARQRQIDLEIRLLEGEIESLQREQREKKTFQKA